MGSVASAPDEEVIEQFHPSYAAWFWVGILTLGFGFIHAWWMRKRLTYTITNKRIVKEKSMRFSTSTDEFRLSDVNRIQTSRSLGEKILGGGTIVLDTGVDELTIKAVPNYTDVVDTLRRVHTE